MQTSKRTSTPSEQPVKRAEPPAQPSESTAAGSPAPVAYRVPSLRNRRQCARYAATVVRAMHRGNIGIEHGKGLLYGVQVLANLYSGLEFDDRLAAMEVKLQALLGGGALPVRAAPRLIAGELVGLDED
jgi:hypothetical protein